MDLQDIDFVYFQTRGSLYSSDFSKKVHIFLIPSSFKQHFSYILYQEILIFANLDMNILGTAKLLT